MKTMKQLLNSETRLIKGKKINLFIPIFNVLFLVLILICCKRSNESILIGKWQINHITYSDGSKSHVPDNEKYFINFNNKRGKNIFSVDKVFGSWFIKDSNLYFENIPVGKTLIDSIFVVNDNNGNTSLLFQNGDTKIATYIDGKIRLKIEVRVHYNF